MGKKIVGKKCETTFFIFTRISLPKNGGKKLAKQFFHEHTYSANKKCGEKNRLKQVRKNFLYANEYRDQKMGGNKRTIQIFHEHTYSAGK